MSRNGRDSYLSLRQASLNEIAPSHDVLRLPEVDGEWPPVADE